jgi:hypothetical protein
MGRVIDELASGLLGLLGRGRRGLGVVVAHLRRGERIRERSQDSRRLGCVRPE